MPLFQSIGQTLGLIPACSSKIKKASSITIPDQTNSSLAARLESQSISPNSRTKEWLANNSPEKNFKVFKDSHTSSVLGVKNGGIIKHAHTPKSGKSKSKYLAVKFEQSSSSSSSPKSEAKRKSGLWSLLTGFRFGGDDEAVIASEVPTIKSDESVTEGSTLVEDVIDTIETEDLDGPTNVEGPTMLAQTEGGDLRIQDENGIIKKPDEADFDDFTDEEYFLFHKLNARGMEPLIPAGWTKDFSTLDWDLFSNDPRKTYIRSTKAPEYHALKALYNLFEIGIRARDALITGIPPEKPIRRFLNEYFAWTMHDAKLKKVPHIPVLAIVVAQPYEDINSVVNRCTDRMHSLGRQYREAWLIEDENDTRGLGVYIPRYKRRLPTILGIIVKHTAVAFVTYDASVPGRPVRNMGVWNLADDEQDTWHALAFAIFMICARNYLLGLQRVGEIGQDDGVESDDPDA
ncbi:MAG: hypothetical protein Q9195_003713 [Heterodermia aff. obscurata]